jgi:1-acyl-sn-glycerol-3-phosphate acyltransferase
LDVDSLCFHHIVDKASNALTVRFFRDIYKVYLNHMRWLYGLMFKLCGWKVTGTFPSGVRKYIIAVAPHTSNWDFLVGIAARSILHIERAKFLGKSQLFRPPFGWLFRQLGGYPVERGSSHDMVKNVAELFRSHEDFVLAIAPEGTRKKVEKLRTGFYYIAKEAQVPIFPVGFDFKKKEVVIGPPLYPGQDVDADFEKLRAFYRTITGRNPELGL